MPTTQPPGKKPVRPVRAANLGNGGRMPNGEHQNSKTNSQLLNQPDKNKSSMTKSALKFAFMPEVGRSLEGIKLAWHLIINLVAQIYIVVGLIPENHPCTNFRNVSEYKLKDIIKIAYSSLKWEKSQVPQIIIFFAVLLFLLFIALSLVTLILNVGVNAAHAADTPGNSANDILNSIFNLQGSGMIPTAFGAMLRAYSNIILVLAGIILLYLIMQYVVESARHGQPGGKSFNHAWAPIRLVFALGLLIPLSSGLNSGQYITLYLAKWGSDMASNVYKQFAVSLQNGQGVTASQVTVQPKKALENLFNLEACLAEYNTKNPGSAMPPPAIKDDEDHPNFKIIDFTGATLGDVTGCGKIHLYSNPSATNPNEILLNQQAQFFTANLPAIQQLAQDYVSHYDPQSVNYYQAIQTSEYSSQITNLAKAYSQQINSASQTAFSNTNISLGEDMQKSINGLGWVTAPTWLQRIANRNSEVADAEFSLPNVTNNSQDYAGMATGQTSAPSSASTPQEIESWKQQTASKAIDIGQNAIQRVFGTIPQFGPLIYKKLIIDQTNPFCSLVAFGKTLFRSAEAAYMGWLEVVTALGLSATSVLGNQINVGQDLLNAITPMVTAFIGLTFMTGMMLGFMLPLIPTIRFIFAVLGWIIMVFVAVMGMPLFALAHLKTGGEGWIGSLQVAGAYNLLIGIIVRPTLIILGFIASLIVFNSIMKMAGTLLYMSASSDTQLLSASSVGINSAMSVVDMLDPFAQVIKIFIFSGFVQAVANSCFKLVDIVPSQAMTWMGTGAMSSAVEDGAGEATSLAQGLGQQMNSAISQRLPTAATNRLRDMQQLRTAENRITPATSGGGEEKDDSAGSENARKPGGQPPALAAPQSTASQIPATDMGDGEKGAQDNGGDAGAQAAAVSFTPGKPPAGAPSAGGAKSAGASSSAPTAGKPSAPPKTANAAAPASSGKSSSSSAKTDSNQPAPTDPKSVASSEWGKSKIEGGYLSGIKEGLLSNPFRNPSAKDFGGFSQNKAIGWGIAKGAARAFIPGGWMMGRSAKNNLRESVKNAAKEGFYKSEEEKANQSATGAPVDTDNTEANQPTSQPTENLSDPNIRSNYENIKSPLNGREKPKWMT